MNRDEQIEAGARALRPLMAVGADVEGYVAAVLDALTPPEAEEHTHDTAVECLYWFFKMVKAGGPDGSDMDCAVVDDAEVAARLLAPWIDARSPIDPMPPTPARLTPPEGVDTAHLRRRITEWQGMSIEGHGLYARYCDAQEMLAQSLALCDELDRRTQAEGEWEQVPMGWRNTETGELRATWMPEKPKGPWEMIYVHRPAPTKGETP